MGAFPSELSFREGEARAPCPLAGRNVGQVLVRAGARRHLPLPGGRHPVPVTQRRRGRPPGPRPAPGRPNGWRWDCPQGGRAPIQGTRNGEDHESKPFVRSTPARHQLPSLRRGPEAALRPRGGRLSLAAAAATLPLCHIIRDVEGLCGIINGVKERLLPAAQPLNSGYPGGDCLVHKTQMH